MSKKHKKVCRVLNYIDHSLIVILTILIVIQEANGLLSNIGTRTPLSKIPLLDPLLF